MNDDRLSNSGDGDFHAVLEHWRRYFEMAAPDPDAFLKWVTHQLSPSHPDQGEEALHPLMEQLLAHCPKGVREEHGSRESRLKAFLAWAVESVHEHDRFKGDQGPPNPEPREARCSTFAEKATAKMPPAAAHQPLDQQKDDPWQVPEQIGPFSIQEVIGSGGMGIIFKGLKQNDSHQVAAVKVLQSLHNQCLSAFKKEMAIVSSLQHPNIAHYLDHGMLQTQRPWLALEYVKGVPVDEWCHREKPSIKRLLRVFLKICEAVTYAQNNLIIHRDLKPSNILIQDDDEPKLLDFGIAAVLKPETQEQQTLTGLHLHAMTPDYASPEQIRQERLTAATDVYSMGVILYQMLTGEKPYKMDTDSLIECHNHLTRIQITKPSRKFAEIAKLGRLGSNPICGDLDAICLKAMEQNSTDRYENASELAADLERVRGGYPVHARNNTVRYRLSKYFRRHQFQIFWAGALFLVLSMATISSVGQSKMIAQERDLVAMEKDRAEKIAGFLISMFQDIDPDLNASGGKDIKAFDILENGRREILSDQIADPLMRAQLMLTMGEVYRTLGKYRSSHELLEEARALPLGKSIVAFDVEMASIETLLAEGLLHRAWDRVEALSSQWTNNQDPKIQLKLNDARGRIAVEMGRYQAADGYYQEALSLQGALPPELTLGLLLGRARLLEKMNLHRESLTEFERMLQFQKDLGHNEHSLFIKALLGIGKQNQALARFDLAQEAYDQAMQMLENRFGAKHPYIIKILMAQARLKATQGDLPAAEQELLQARKIAKALLREDHPVKAEVLKELSLVYESMGNHEQAETLLRKSYSDLANLFGEEHPVVAECLKIWGDIYHQRAAFEDGMRMYYRALAIQNKITKNQGDALKMATLLGIAKINIDRGKLPEAEEVLRKLIETQTLVYSEVHPATTESMLYLTDVLKRQRKYEEGEELCRRGLLIETELFGEHHLRVANWMGLLAVFHQTKGELKAAKVLYEKVINIKSEQLGPDHSSVLSEVYGFSGVLTQLKLWDEAEAGYKRVLEGNIRQFGYPHLYNASVFFGLANMMRDKGDIEASQKYHLEEISICDMIGELDKQPCLTGLRSYGLFLASEVHDYQGALTVFQESFRIAPQYHNQPSLSKSIAEVNIGFIYLSLGEFSDAEEFLTRAYLYRRDTYGMSHHKTISSLEYLARALYFLGDLDRAEDLLCQAVFYHEGKDASRSARLATNKLYLGRIKHAKGLTREARYYYNQALGLFEPEDPAEQSLSVKIWSALALSALDEGDLEEARFWLETSLRATAEGSPEQAKVLTQLAEVALTAGEYGRANQLLDDALVPLESAQNPLFMADWYHQKARALLVEGRLAEASKRMAVGYALMASRYGENYPHRIMALLDFAEIQGEAGAVSEALVLAERGVGLSRALQGEDSVLLKVALSIKGRLLARSGRQETATLLLRQSHDELLRRLGPEHYLTRAARSRQNALP